MRNLKRVLALAMAMVMILGMMVIGSSAASYTDAAAIDAQYAEAIEVLSNMGVFKGQSTTSAVFAPKAILTRAEAATLIYRVITGDVKDAQKQNYDYASLKDVKAGDWYTPYVTYSNNGGYIKGDDVGNFNPYQQVTGIQVMAIMLRAAGYGQNGEYEGAGWMDNILTDAQKVGITGKISTATLMAPATRELVAQLIFNAITNVKMVTYSPVLGYIAANLADGKNNVPQTLGEKVFGLVQDKTGGNDDWGRPYDYKWIIPAAKKGAKDTVLYTAWETPLAVYTEAAKACDIYADSGLKKGTKLDVYTNGVVANDAYTINDGNAKYGAQGRLVEVYSDDMVVIDTYLAKVTDVVPEKTDSRGHVTDAYSEVTVYENVAGLTIKDKDIEGNDYAKDAYILVYYNEKTEELEAVQEAENFIGAQSKIWYNAEKRTIDDVDYMEAVNYVLNDARYDDAKYTWFLDLYGNVIGSAEIETIYTYAVLKDMIWNVGRPGYAEATIVYMDGTEATVTVATIDGTSELDGSFIVDENDEAPILSDLYYFDFPFVSSDSKYNGLYEGYALYKISYNAKGEAILDGYNEVLHTGPTTLEANTRQFIDAEGGKVFLTASTEVLVREGTARTGYTYVPTTIAELTNYAWNTVEMYYTTKTVAGFTYADRIYVKSAIAEVEMGTHLFTTTDTYARVAGSDEDWVMTVVIDGVEREIATNIDNVLFLAANKGKMFHVAWETNPYEGIYGYVKNVYLVNEAKDDATHLSTECDYLSGTITVMGDSIFCDGDSYTVTADTKYVGVADYAGLQAAVKQGKGVWVIADAKNVQYAKVVYVGTKLSADTSVTVYYETGCTSTWNSTYDTLTIKLPIGTANTDLKIAANVANTVIKYGANAYLDVTPVYPDTIPGTYKWTVYAEDGVASDELTVVVEATEAGAVALKSFCGYQAYAYAGSYADADQNNVTVKFLNSDKIAFGTIAAEIENATITGYQVWDANANEYIDITGDITISDTPDVTWIKVTYKDQAGNTACYEINAVYEND